MNLCVITSSFPANPEDGAAAAGLFVRDFCLALAKKGHEVTVVTQNKRDLTKQSPQGISVEWFPWRGGGKPLNLLSLLKPNDALSMISLFRNAYRTLEQSNKERPFDHVLAMWAVPAGALAARLKTNAGIPFSTWCLGSDIWTYGRNPLFRPIISRILRSSELIYADGMDLSKEAAKISSRCCSFLPSSRQLNRSLIQTVPMQTAGTNFLFIGRYHQVKGVAVLLDAMAKYRKAGHKGHLYMFGGGPLDDYVRTRAAKPDLEDCVTVGGFADETTYISYLKACDVFVIPSRLESIPVSFSDALQMGTPVIVSDVGDMGSLLRKKPAGLIVPSEDHAALSAAMARMNEVGAGGFKAALEDLARQFDISTTTDRWISDVRRHHLHSRDR